MSEQLHTQEPWVAHDTGFAAIAIYSEADDSMAIASTSANTSPKSMDAARKGVHKANASRIVACVNACAGMQTEVLESLKVIDAVGSAVKHGRLCGELLSHLKFAVSILEKIPAMGSSAQVEAMKAAIAKAEVI